MRHSEFRPYRTSDARVCARYLPRGHITTLRELGGVPGGFPLSRAVAASIIFHLYARRAPKAQANRRGRYRTTVSLLQLARSN